MITPEELIYGALSILGVTSGIAFLIRPLRSWRHMTVCGFGASLGGLVTCGVLEWRVEDLLDLAVWIIAAVGLKGVVAAFPVEIEFLIFVGCFLVGMTAGAYSLWFIYNRRKQKDNETP
jgi:hypothetical protein